MILSFIFCLFVSKTIQKLCFEKYCIFRPYIYRYCTCACCLCPPTLPYGLSPIRLSTFLPPVRPILTELYKNNFNCALVAKLNFLQFDVSAFLSFIHPFCELLPLRMVIIYSCVKEIWLPPPPPPPIRRYSGSKYFVI